MNPGLLQSIEEKKILDDQLRNEMKKVIGEFKDRFLADRQVVAAA
jgi:hypothetical protein